MGNGWDRFMKKICRLCSILVVCSFLLCIYAQQQAVLYAEQVPSESGEIPEFRIEKGTVFRVDNVTLEASPLSSPDHDIRELVPIPNSSDFLAIIYENGKSYVCYADADFKSIKRFTDGPSDEGAAVTSDGKYLLFDGDVDGNRDIYRVNIDGTNLQRLTTHPARDFSGSWSPDGTKIVFATARDEHIGIYTMNADGSEQSTLLATEDDNLDPSWSPKGDMIAFSKNGQIPCLFRLEDGRWGPVIPATLFCRHPSWLPDGDGIAFAGILEHIAGYEIYAVQEQWSTIRKLTGTKLPKSSPYFSYDGNVIYYCESEDSDQDKESHIK